MTSGIGPPGGSPIPDGIGGQVGHSSHSEPSPSGSTGPPGNETAATVPPDPLASRIAESVERWRRRLLDLTRRNRALNFKMTKVSTLAIVGEEPAEVFRQMWGQEASMKFQAARSAEEAKTEPGEPSARADEDDWVDAEDEQGVQSSAAEARPYDPDQLDSTRTDRVLEVAATPEQLDRSLRRIDEQARLTVEEQGVNTLFLALGMLHYRESADSEETFRAPLILLPVELKRKSARTGFTIVATDDDPLVNPALIEYLRHTFGISLPDLPANEDGAGSAEIQPWFLAVAEAVAGLAGWAVKSEIFLGLFSFQKFVMYKDLEAHARAFVAHRLIRQLVGRSGGVEIGLPDGVRAIDLDSEFPPEATAQVVDADSSQLRAIVAVNRGHDLVLEGPPGTGKSQTITNLIAQALSDGKTVLFVSEKMAALEVVYRRLVQAGLGEFCLELHSTKANKRAVMQNLATSLDASLQRPAVPELSAQRLAVVRDELTQYVKAVHTPFGALAMAPYRAYGELARVLDAPKVPWARSVEAITRDQLEQSEHQLKDFVEAGRAIGDPSKHPWRDTKRTFYAESDLDSARRLLVLLRTRIAECQSLATQVQAAFGFGPIQSAADVGRACEVARVLERSPGAPVAVLSSEEWDTPRSDAVALIALGRKFVELRDEVFKHFSHAVLSSDHASDIEFMEDKLRRRFTMTAWMDGRFRAIRKRWRAYRLPGYQPKLLDQAKDMRVAQQLRGVRSDLGARGGMARAMFGPLWRGEESDWVELDRYVEWVVEFRRVFREHGLGPRTIEVASSRAPDVSSIEALRVASAGALGVLAEVRGLVEWPTDYLDGGTFSDIDQRAAAMSDSTSLAPRWATFEVARSKAAGGVAGEVLSVAMSGEVASTDLPAAFRRAFYQRWLSDVMQGRDSLRSFHTATHENRVAEFRELDEAVLRANQALLVARRRELLQTKLRAAELGPAMGFLRRQMARQRGLSPLRRTMQEADPAIRAIKPCFLMSPLSVAQLLPGSEPTFDLVVFDEASQLPPEDAVGAIVRGRQLVVVGDPKQLPPTNFFSSMLGQSVAHDEDGTPIYEDGESVLEEFMGAGVPMSRLRWHYRSVHESLITFSNLSFYEADLHTFPSVETDSDLIGLQFVYVPDGIYEGKGLNRAEARRVADAVVEHAKRHPDLTLGVGTFNLRQQIAIQDELESRRRADPDIETFFSRSVKEPFFVKNLENVQGDERDVIFISVTYAKGPDGRLRYNFGPLNSANGWRRLNVLTTRARRRMRVFASIRGDEIRPTATGSDGPRLLRDFLVYAEHGRLDSPMVSAGASAESPFERDVYAELSRHGLQLEPQVGASGYRIDFGVRDEAVLGRFICGIECDGAAYHASETARDRDRLRQDVLEARGWTILRVWSTDWFKDRQGQVSRLLGLVSQARDRVLEEERAEAAARTLAQEEQARATQRTAESASRTVEISGTEPAGERARPVTTEAQPYRLADVAGRHSSEEILDADVSRLVNAAKEIASIEAPLHVTDLTGRIGDMWGVGRVGSRIAAKVMQGIQMAARRGAIELRGEFVWVPGHGCTVRSRSGTGISAERIAPEEYQEATVQALRGAGVLPRDELIAAVRSLLGFSRTGPVLEDCIGRAVGTLLTAGRLGEGSGGITFRE